MVGGVCSSDARRTSRIDELSSVRPRARDGDSESFSELSSRHAPAVRVAVRDTVSDRDEQLDLVQETFARALQRLASLNDPALFRAWVLQIARHAAIDHRRRASRAVEVSIDEPDRPQLPSKAPSPDELAELSELASRLQTGFARLSQRDATALSLAVHLGFGPAEIAIALGTTRANAKVILHRARRRLRKAAELEAA